MGDLKCASRWFSFASRGGQSSRDLLFIHLCDDARTCASKYSRGHFPRVSRIARRRRVDRKQLAKRICNTISSLCREGASVRTPLKPLWKINTLKYIIRQMRWKIHRERDWKRRGTLNYGQEDQSCLRESIKIRIKSLISRVFNPISRDPVVKIRCRPHLFLFSFSEVTSRRLGTTRARCHHRAARPSIILPVDSSIAGSFYVLIYRLFALVRTAEMRRTTDLRSMTRRDMA